jgi:hypothetical protein
MNFPFKLEDIYTFELQVLSTCLIYSFSDYKYLE